MEESVADGLLDCWVPDGLCVCVCLLTRGGGCKKGQPRQSSDKQNEPDQAHTQPSLMFALAAESIFDLVEQKAHGGEAVFALGGEAALKERA